MAEKRPADHGGIRQSRTTTLFRITNFELFAKPVRIDFRCNVFILLVYTHAMSCIYSVYNYDKINYLEQASDGNRSRLHYWMSCVHCLPELHT